MPILISNSLDPYHNLAVESCLLDGLGPALPVLFLWQSARAVVIGKNQNPWRECNLAYMQAHDIPLCRRESGGGAVYQDEGNLNFCMVLDRITYREDRQFKIIIKALSHAGIAARREGQSNLFSGDRKISGNAYCLRRDRAMHHGTLLVSTDLEPLRESLRPPVIEISTHAIASIPARVANLEDIRSGITLLQVQEAVLSSWGETYPEHADREDEDRLHQAELDRRRKHLASDAWCYGHTPRFSLQLHATAADTLKLEIKKGMISALKSPDMPEPDLAWLRSRVLNQPFGAFIPAADAPSTPCRAAVDALNAATPRLP